MRKIAKLLGVLLACVLCFAMIAQAEPAGEAGEVVYDGPEMTLSFSFSSNEELSIVYTNPCKMITERTGGKVQFDNYFSGSLAPAADALDACGTGLADMADIRLTNTPDRSRYSQQVTGYPFLGFTSFCMAADVMREFIPNNEYCMAEFEAANIFPLFFTGVWGTAVVMKDDEEILSPEDLAGKKMMVSSPTEAMFLTNAGGTPVPQPPTEMFQNFQSGLVDGSIYGLYICDIFGALELAHHVSMLENSFTTGCRVAGINLDLWNSFTPELQQIFIECFNSPEEWDLATEYWIKSDQDHLDNCEKWGIHVVDVKGDDMKPWIEAAKPLGDAKMQELYDAGNTHVFEVLDALNEAIDNYDGEFK